MGLKIISRSEIKSNGIFSVCGHVASKCVGEIK
jgi:hypothetical protein